MKVVKVLNWRQGGKERTVSGQRTSIRTKRRLLRSAACSLGSSFGYVSGNIVHECVKFVRLLEEVEVFG